MQFGVHSLWFVWLKIWVLVLFGNFGSEQLVVKFGFSLIWLLLHFCS